MIRRRFRLLWVVALVCLGGCASVTKDIRVETEANANVDFSGYTTFAWLGAAGLLNDPRGTWAGPEFDMGSEVKFLIDRELREKGMTQVVASPSVAVAFALGIDMEALELVQDPSSEIELIENSPKGALVIVLLDPATRRPVFAGAAVADILDNPPKETVKKRLDYAVTQILKGVPR